MLHRALDIIDIDLRNSFLCCVFWIAAHQALYCGIYDIAWKFLRFISVINYATMLQRILICVQCHEKKYAVSFTSPCICL